MGTGVVADSSSSTPAAYGWPLWLTTTMAWMASSRMMLATCGPGPPPEWAPLWRSVLSAASRQSQLVPTSSGVCVELCAQSLLSCSPSTGTYGSYGWYGGLTGGEFDSGFMFCDSRVLTSCSQFVRDGARFLRFILFISSSCLEKGA